MKEGRVCRRKGEGKWRVSVYVFRKEGRKGEGEVESVGKMEGEKEKKEDDQSPKKIGFCNE